MEHSALQIPRALPSLAQEGSTSGSLAGPAAAATSTPAGPSVSDKEWKALIGKLVRAHASQLMPHALRLVPHTSLMPPAACLTPHASHLMPRTSCLAPHASRLSCSWNSALLLQFVVGVLELPTCMALTLQTNGLAHQQNFQLLALCGFRCSRCTKWWRGSAPHHCCLCKGLCCQ